MTGVTGKTQVGEAGTRRRKLSFKARDRGETKERILKEAIREFAEYGFLGARVERIVKRSDVSMRMLYHYYESKDHLYVCVLERVYSDVRIAERQFDPSACTPEEGISRLIEFTFDHFVQHPDLIRLVMGENMLRAAYLRRSQLIPSMNVQLQRTMKLILDQGAAAGVFRTGIDPVQLWLTIFSLCWTHLANRHTLSWMLQADLSDASLLGERRAHVQEVILRYLRT